MNRFYQRIDRRYAKVCLYAGVTVVLTLAACLLLYTASPVFATAWRLFCAVVTPMVCGAALSYVLNPLVKLISRRLRRFPHFADAPMKRRSAAVVVSLVLVLLVASLLALIMLVMITHSVSSLNWASIQALVGSAQMDFVELLQNIVEQLRRYGLVTQEGETMVLGIFAGVKDFFTTAVFALIFCVYFLVDGPRVSTYLGRVAHALVGDRATASAAQLIADADRVFSGYFRGQAIDACIVGVMSGVVLTLVGVPFAPVVGLLTGLGNMIPYIGGPVGFASIVLMCLPSAAWGKMVAGLLAMSVVMFVDGNIVNPKLLSDNVEVHPILVIAALIAGGAVGGIAGMLVAVPAAAFIKIQLDRWVESREAGAGDAGVDERSEDGEQ